MQAQREWPQLEHPGPTEEVFVMRFHLPRALPAVKTLALALAVALGLGLWWGASSGVEGEEDREATCGLSVDPWASGAAETQIRLFGVPEDEVTAYFQGHRLAVGGLWDRPAEGEGPWQTGLDYPSFNSGGEGGGSTVVYSHRVTLVGGDDRVAAPADLDRRVLLILAPKEGEASTYKWVGCAFGGENEGLDWFADKPELLYRGGAELGRTEPRKPPRRP